MNLRAMENPPDPTMIKTLVDKLSKAEVVADIHQIEVLRAAQGKGIASALLNVANWDIIQAKNIPFTIGRVLDTNPEQEKVLTMFEKDGFMKIYCPGETDGRSEGTPNYYLLIKENSVRS